MTETPLLLILRHGQTTWNRDGRMQGQLDSPLTARGRAQAVEQGKILRAEGVTAEWDFFTSPLGRARHTAELALEGLAAARPDARLAEIHMGDWQGLSRDEVAARWPGAGYDEERLLDWYDSAPGGEGVAAITARCAAFLSELRRPTVVVTHGITSRFLRAALTGGDPARMTSPGGGQGLVARVADGRQDWLWAR
ncbi:histidine phosphatase family protein [Acidimangrovimonas pyrenivorans]|uniref:Histidine phosphatase family protein n=1 Tax=Acidimangrovimonas pyrenivorans TaxID=2030798 RepID=A0ABV7AGW4_9RHOB